MVLRIFKKFVDDRQTFFCRATLEEEEKNGFDDNELVSHACT